MLATPEPNVRDDSRTAAIRCIVRDRIATVTINRPARMNALDAPANRQLHDVFRDLEADPEVWVVILTGQGDRSFCAGGDLGAAGSAPGQPEPGPRVSFGGGLTGVAGRKISVTKPLIAAVNGVAIGGGFELALSCDVIVAAETAHFAFPEARIGWVSDSPCVHRAVRHLPYHLAMGLLLTGRGLSADDALRFGVVNEVAPAGATLDRALDWARSMLEGSPLALRAVKEAAVVGLNSDLDTALATRWETIEEFQDTFDRQEGVRAFREKRRPRWEGR